jgi:hypothetical protein
MSDKSVYDLVEERLDHDLRNAEIDDVVQIDADGKLSFELLLEEDYPLTYKMLDQLSTTFKTKKINVRHERRERPISDVTWDSYGAIIIEVRGASVPEPPSPPPPPPGPKRGYLIVAGGPILASAWARGRQCQKDEAYYVGSPAEVDHLPRNLYKIVVVGPPSKNKDKIVAALVKLGFKMLEE